MTFLTAEAAPVATWCLILASALRANAARVSSFALETTAADLRAFQAVSALVGRLEAGGQDLVRLGEELRWGPHWGLRSSKLG